RGGSMGATRQRARRCRQGDVMGCDEYSVPLGEVPSLATAFRHLDGRADDMESLRKENQRLAHMHRLAERDLVAMEAQRDEWKTQCECLNHMFRQLLARS